jgi:hypothetical protein
MIRALVHKATIQLMRMKHTATQTHGDDGSHMLQCNLVRRC